LQAFLAETTITVSDLLSLQPGDIIPTDKPANAELILQAEGRNKFAGRLGRHKEFRALKISRLAEEEERL
jgi:flagellar motor switch protein FliM